MREAVPRRLPKYCFEEERPSGIRVRLRIPGHAIITLKGSPWTPAFMESYHNALRGEIAAPEQSVEHGTWEWLCRQFFGSAEFKMSPRTGRALSDGTQIRRRKHLELTFAEKIAPDSALVFSKMPIGRFTPQAVRVLRDRLAKTPAAANERMKAMRQAFRYAIARDLLRANPVREVERFRLVTDGFYTWTEADVAQFEARHVRGSKARRALYLLLYSGPRRSDAVRLGRQHVRDEWLSYRPRKTENTTGRTITVPVLQILADELALAPKDRLTFLETEYGKPFTANGFGNWFKARCREAGLPQCSAHGLRKAGATLAAERGATPHQLMAIYGWETLQEAERYTKKAQMKRLAGEAMGLLAAPNPASMGAKRRKRQ